MMHSMSTGQPQQNHHRYNPMTFDFLTGALLVLWLTQLVPDEYIIPIMVISVATSAVLRLYYHRQDNPR